MDTLRLTRRRYIQAVAGASVLALLDCNRTEQTMLTLYTFGDSILDCGRYNEFGVHPGQLLVQNDDRLFPEFQGQDLRSREPARLEHRARDGATVEDLPFQARSLRVEGRAIGLITIGGNDLLRGLIRGTGAGIASFANALDAFVQQLPIRPVLLGNVYDPTLGDDRRNFVGVDAAIARKNQRADEYDNSRNCQSLRATRRSPRPLLDGRSILVYSDDRAKPTGCIPSATSFSPLCCQ